MHQNGQRQSLPVAAVVAWWAVTAVVVVSTVFMVARRSTHPEFFGRYSAPLLAAIVIGLAASLALVTARRSGLLPKAYAARGTLAAVAMSLIGGFLVLEAGVRAIDPLGVSYFQAVQQYQLDRVADPLLIYRHRPGASYEYQGIEVQFNELGLRDRPTPPRDAVRHRVLFLGDSVAFGWGVREEDTVTAHLERLLSERLGGPVGVVNSGVPSYNTVQQERFLRTGGLRLQPDAVVLLYVYNDVQVHESPYDPWRDVSLDGKPPLTVIDLLSRRSWVVQLFHYMRSTGRYGPDLGGPESQGWAASMRALRAIQQQCEAAGMPFIPVFFRLQPDADQRLFEDVSKTLSPLHVHDTAPWFAGAPLEDYVNSKIDSHPNARGHRLMAAGMSEVLANALATRMRGDSRTADGRNRSVMNGAGRTAARRNEG